MDYTKPILTEPGVTSFLESTLRQCRDFKVTWQNILFNIGLFLLLIIILGLVLYVKFKGKLTPVEIQIKEQAKHEFLLSTIHDFQVAKKEAHQALITGLPNWDNEFGKRQ